MSFVNKELLMQRATLLNSNTEAGRLYYGSVYNMIIDMPTVDAVEVVRCENCKFYKPFKKVEDFDGQCEIHCIQTDREFYCQYGEKKV